MREDAPRHRDVNAFVEGLRRAPEPFGVSDVVLSGTMRVLTHPRVFVPPDTAGRCPRIRGHRPLDA